MKNIWWVLLLRGLISIIFGAIVLGHPALTLKLLVFFFCMYVLATGLVALWLGISQRKQNKRWWITVLEGLAGIIVGLIIWFWPAISGLMLLYVIAAWAVVTGMVQLYSAIVFGKQVVNSFWVGLSGLLSIFFGCFIVAHPAEGALALTWVIGFYALIFGVLFIVAALRARQLGKFIG